MSKPEKTRLDTIHHMAEKLTDSIERIKAALDHGEIVDIELGIFENALTDFKSKIDSINPA